MNIEATEDKEMECFWEKRKIEACIWGIMITSSNFGFQLSKIMNPKTFEEPQASQKKNHKLSPVFR